MKTSSRRSAPLALPLCIFALTLPAAGCRDDGGGGGGTETDTDVGTGTGSDGARGIREIKAKGGITLVQDPEEAEYDGMPRSAIATGDVDAVLPVAEIPGAVLRYMGTEPRVRAE